jgi:aminomethyltransferase
MTSPSAPAQKTILHDQQASRGGKMIDFHGWIMPVQFAGITAEHVAVRTACGVFDLNHMGRLRVAGPAALAFLEERVCRGLRDMKNGAVRYGLVLAVDGTVEDDVLVSREADDAFHIVVNASNKEKVLDLWRPAVPVGTVLSDLSTSQGMIAVQGPQAITLLKTLQLDGSPLGNYRFTDVPWRGTVVRLSRTGYTGEDGCECFLPADRTAELWTAVVEAGATLCGLGARDTLRTEAAMPLYGNELDRTVNPAEAGLGFAVNKAGGFIGAGSVLAALSAPARRLVGLVMAEKRVPRTGYAVLAAGEPVGRITSGTLSPTLGSAIGMAYVPAALAAPGTALQVDVRGTAIAATVVPLPFYTRTR